MGICTLFMFVYNCIVQTSIKLRPDFAIAHGNLGSCHYDRGDIDAAIRSFKYAIQLEPNFPDAYNNLGNALKESGDLDEAIQCYRAALRLKPDHPHAYNNLGKLWFQRDNSLLCFIFYVYILSLSHLIPTLYTAY